MGETVSDLVEGKTNLFGVSLLFQLLKESKRRHSPLAASTFAETLHQVKKQHFKVWNWGPIQFATNNMASVQIFSLKMQHVVLHLPVFSHADFYIFLIKICDYFSSKYTYNKSKKCAKYLRNIHRRRIRQKGRQRALLLFGGRNSFNSIPHYRFSTMG